MAAAATETTTHEQKGRPGRRPINQLVNPEDAAASGRAQRGPAGGGAGFHKEQFGLPHVDSEQALRRNGDVSEERLPLKKSGSD